MKNSPFHSLTALYSFLEALVALISKVCLQRQIILLLQINLMYHYNMNIMNKCPLVMLTVTLVMEGEIL